MKRFVFVLMVITTVISFVVKAEAFPGEGLVLHLSFDQSTIEGDKVKDLSEQGNDGVIFGAEVTPGGIFEEALQLNGIDAYVEVPLKPSITFSRDDNSFTIQIWVKGDPDAIPPSETYFIGNYGAGSLPFWALGTLDPPNTGRMTFHLRDTDGQYQLISTEDNSFFDGKWHQLVGIRDVEKKEVRFYIDCALINKVESQTGVVDSGNAIWIGRVLDRYIQGLVDDAKIWNRALSDDELQMSMEASQAINPSSKTATLWGLVKKHH